MTAPMRDDAGAVTGDAEIQLITCVETTWLLTGEDYMAALLEGDAPYPVPVYCHRVADTAALNALLATRGLVPQNLWAIHPDIIARLAERGELVPPADAQEG